MRLRTIPMLSSRRSPAHGDGPSTRCSLLTMKRSTPLSRVVSLIYNECRGPVAMNPQKSNPKEERELLNRVNALARLKV